MVNSFERMNTDVLRVRVLDPRYHFEGGLACIVLDTSALVHPTIGQLVGVARERRIPLYTTNQVVREFEDICAHNQDNDDINWQSIEETKQIVSSIHAQGRVISIGLVKREHKSARVEGRVLRELERTTQKYVYNELLMQHFETIYAALQEIYSYHITADPHTRFKRISNNAVYLGWMELDIPSNITDAYARIHSAFEMVDASFEREVKRRRAEVEFPGRYRESYIEEMERAFPENYDRIPHMKKDMITILLHRIEEEMCVTSAKSQYRRRKRKKTAEVGVALVTYGILAQRYPGPQFLGAAAMDRDLGNLVRRRKERVIDYEQLEPSA